MNTPKTKDIVIIKQQILELSRQMEVLLIALKGNASMDITGIFDRLKDAEKHAKECDFDSILELIKKFFDKNDSRSNQRRC